LAKRAISEWYIWGWNSPLSVGNLVAKATLTTKLPLQRTKVSKW